MIVRQALEFAIIVWMAFRTKIQGCWKSTEKTQSVSIVVATILLNKLLSGVGTSVTIVELLLGGFNMQGKIIMEMEGNRISVDADISEVNGTVDKVKLLHSLMLGMTDSTEERIELAGTLMLALPMCDAAAERGVPNEG